MDRKVRITADTTCDLSPALLEKYGIRLIPLYVSLGEKSYRDLEDVTPEMLFAFYERTKTLAKTSAINPQDYLEFFGGMVEEGWDVVHFNISSEMSTCHQSALIAARETGHVEVVDTRNLSTGSGLLVLEAAELAASGTSAAEIAKRMRARTAKVNASFVVDTLEYLYKGGRCSALSALGANLLSLKPCIEVRQGKMGVGRKYRGPIEKCLMAYTKDKLAQLETVDPARVFVTSTVTDSRLSAAVIEQLRASGYFKEVLETRAGSTIACHCGPNTLGILYMDK